MESIRSSLYRGAYIGAFIVPMADNTGLKELQNDIKKLLEMMNTRDLKARKRDEENTKRFEHLELAIVNLYTQKSHAETSSVTEQP